jgi:hypothetical protein
MAESPLAQLAQASGMGFAHLMAARERTGKRLEQREEQLSQLQVDPDVSVVLMGSWGRAEVTSGSDDDYMVLVDGPWRPEHEVNPSIEDVARVFDIKPGREGLFGEIVYSDYLVKRIGLQEDDNNNLSRRMLLLLESQPAIGHDRHRAASQEALRGYLEDARKDRSPPRLLLNDIVRYWRTICVDFAGKQRKRRGQGWGIRNVKLRTSRKILFAGGLLPVLECGSMTRSDMEAFLDARLRMPPTDRVAQAFLEAGAHDSGGRALAAYDQFIGLLDKEDFRQALESLSREDADRSNQFLEAARLGRELQNGLLALLFETDTLPPRVREFAIF